MTTLGREVVNALLLGPRAEGRLVHESPVRGDVWAAYASEPNERVDILVEAHRDVPTGTVAARLTRRLYETGSVEAPRGGFGVSFVEGFVTAKLSLEELVSCVLPYTKWSRSLVAHPDQELADAVRREVRWQMNHIDGRTGEARADVEPGLSRLLPTFRILAAIEWARDRGREDRIFSIDDFLEAASAREIADIAARLFQRVSASIPARGGSRESHEVDDTDIFAVSRNRPVETALERSIPAIKADAVSTLFGVSCERIGWAVLDTGIDGSHPAFSDAKRKGANRIEATFDFTRLRRIVTLDHLYNEALLEGNAQAVAVSTGMENVEAVKEDFRTLAKDAQQRRPINWSIAEKYLTMSDPQAPASPHGTHVAGILGGDWREDENDGRRPVARRGVCADIRLYDFRVVGGSPDDTEFAVVGALQFIRHLNSRNNYPQVHGANISLSIRHDVRNYACGRTPVCEEAERTVHAGVVVVAAAGNRGYQSYNLSDGGAFETYAPSSITDPGNAEAVITVGSTHRSSPHSYGVSYFSSRGPTGDGRKKPDLVAPGEKIWSVVPGRTEDALSGTSMAAPHVSGAAALLMARNTEFIGQAGAIKRILCSTCTDLGREENFQGAGMLDILRAMQSI